MENKRSVLKGANITIDDNVMMYGGSILQLSNISRVDIAPIPLGKYIAVILFVMFIIVYKCFQVNILFGFVAVLFCVFGLYGILENSKGKYLIIELNSGNLLCFECKDESFLTKVIDVLIQCLNGNSRKVFINLGNCQIGNYNNINDR